MPKPKQTVEEDERDRRQTNTYHDTGQSCVYNDLYVYLPKQVLTLCSVMQHSWDRSHISAFRLVYALN